MQLKEMNVLGLEPSCVIKVIKLIATLKFQRQKIQWSEFHGQFKLNKIDVNSCKYKRNSISRDPSATSGPNRESSTADD